MVYVTAHEMNPYALNSLAVYKIFHHVFGYLCGGKYYICLKLYYVG